MTTTTGERSTAVLTAAVVAYVLAMFLVSSIPGLSRLVHASVVLMAVGLLYRAAVAGWRIRFDVLLPIFWLFTAYAFASVLWSVQQADALVSGIGLVVDVAGATLVWLALQNGVPLKALGVAAAIGASVQAAVALNQFLLHGASRSEGLTGNANALAIQLSMTAFLLLLTAGRERWTHVLALALVIVATITSGSRKMVFVWFSYALIIGRAVGLRMQRSSLLTAIALFTLPVAAWVFLSYGHILLGPLEELTVVQRIEGTFEGRETGKRSGLIEDALARWWDRPIAGYGINQYRQVSPYAAYSHNNYTEILANFGVIGAGLFYVIHVLVLARAVRGAIGGARDAWVVIAIVLATLLMDVARVSYAGRLTWLMFVVMAFATSPPASTHRTPPRAVVARSASGEVTATPARFAERS